MHFAAHVARCQPCVERGKLLLIGTFANVQGDGSLGIFTTRDAVGSAAPGGAAPARSRHRASSDRSLASIPQHTAAAAAAQRTGESVIPWLLGDCA